MDSRFTSCIPSNVGSSAAQVWLCGDFICNHWLEFCHQYQTCGTQRKEGKYVNVRLQWIECCDEKPVTMGGQMEGREWSLVFTTECIMLFFQKWDGVTQFFWRILKLFSHSTWYKTPVLCKDAWSSIKTHKGAGLNHSTSLWRIQHLFLHPHNVTSCVTLILHLEKESRGVLYPTSWLKLSCLSDSHVMDSIGVRLKKPATAYCCKALGDTLWQWVCKCKVLGHCKHCRKGDA